MRAGNDEKRAVVTQAIIPLKALLFRLSLVFLLLLSFAIIIVSKVDTKATENIRAKTMDIVVPVLSVLSSPVNAYHSMKQSLGEMVFIYQENSLLREENEKLRRLKMVAVELDAENKRLKNLINYLPDHGTSYMTARVVGETGGPYSRTAIISSGSNAGIKNGQIVTNSQGLVGRIFEVGTNSSRILLITDINSRVPVMTEESRERAVLAGSNTETPRLDHLPKDTNTKVGERIITSGDGEFFPAGIAVGVVQKADKKSFLVKPMVDWGRLEYVTIADYK